MPIDTSATPIDKAEINAYLAEYTEAIRSKTVEFERTLSASVAKGEISAAEAKRWMVKAGLWTSL